MDYESKGAGPSLKDFGLPRQKQTVIELHSVTKPHVARNSMGLFVRPERSLEASTLVSVGSNVPRRGVRNERSYKPCDIGRQTGVAIKGGSIPSRPAISPRPVVCP